MKPTGNVSPSAPLINDEGKQLTRRFLGNTSRTATPTEKKELRAYLRGGETFDYGRQPRLSRSEPITSKVHEVRQLYFYK